MPLSLSQKKQSISLQMNFDHPQMILLILLAELLATQDEQKDFLQNKPSIFCLLQVQMKNQSKQRENGQS